MDFNAARRQLPRPISLHLIPLEMDYLMSTVTDDFSFESNDLDNISSLIDPSYGGDSQSRSSINALALDGLDLFKPELSLGQVASLFLSDAAEQVPDFDPAPRYYLAQDPVVRDALQRCDHRHHDASTSGSTFLSSDDDPGDTDSSFSLSPLSTTCTSPSMSIISTPDSSNSRIDIEVESKSDPSLSPLQLASNSPPSYPIAVCPALIFPPQPVEWNETDVDDEACVQVEAGSVSDYDASSEIAEAPTPSMRQTEAPGLPVSSVQESCSPSVAIEASKRPAADTITKIKTTRDVSSRPGGGSDPDIAPRLRPRRACTRNARYHSFMPLVDCDHSSFSSASPLSHEHDVNFIKARSVGRKAKRGIDDDGDEYVDEHSADEADGEYADELPQPKRRKTAFSGSRISRRRKSSGGKSAKPRCEKCRLTFTRMFDLKRHQQHTKCGGAKYVGKLSCPYCPEADSDAQSGSAPEDIDAEEDDADKNKLSRIDSLNRHIRSKHEGMPLLPSGKK